MPVEINVGPPVLTINQGSTFLVTDLRGEIVADSEQGLFANDTRYVSYYATFANGYSWVLLTSSTTSYHTERIYLTNPPFTTEDGDVVGGTIGLVISRTVGEGLHEDLDLTNYGSSPVRFNFEVALRSDFADIFEVKSHKFVRRGRIVTHWDERHGEFRTSYTNRDFHRQLIYRLSKNDSRAIDANGRITFEVSLMPGASWHSCALYLLVDGQRTRVPIDNDAHDLTESKHVEQHRQWSEQATSLACSNEDVYRFYRQSIDDLGALRLYESDLGPEVYIPAAGVPWFVAIFGRDSLIVSLQTMMVNPDFARGALAKLAELQATSIDDWRDAQPGKMPHEMRFGELAHFHKIPHTPYYGTADATILYLIALHEAWKWLGDVNLLRKYRQVALNCLEWIDRYGDLDGDGFQEYQTHSAQGYENMGWKDSGDGVVYPDGSQVKQPKALCELQGYVFDAWHRMAEVFDALGEPDRAGVLRQKAAVLQTRFEETFWCEELDAYAFGLDPKKQQIKTLASNPGHCLWSGIASPEHARRIVQRFSQPDMWSGWGIRTLSMHNPAYNPFSYQLGSVWPHDNAIIAAGFKRYGFAEAAARIARDISEAASSFASYRIPELYAGIERQPDSFPVQYLGANVPQAWAAGSAFLLIQTLTGLRADAPNNRLYVDPQLPPWLPDLKLSGLNVGKSTLDLRFWRENEQNRWEATLTEGTLTVTQEADRPW